MKTARGKMSAKQDEVPTIRVRTRIPPIYRGSLGLPVRWQDEQTGELPAAVRAYFAHRIGEGPAPSSQQFGLLLDYLCHVICAPCWNPPAREARDAGDPRPAARLIRLRMRIARCELETSDDVARWIDDCLDIGIDPL